MVMVLVLAVILQLCPIRIHFFLPPLLAATTTTTTTSHTQLYPSSFHLLLPLLLLHLFLYHTCT